ncbi:hypothetical protein CC86DRAFT_148859 [Ophiobolus disseminans]|uniref:Carrier domain-containing protein n=1 Tax=Ophiobolus disseminans TaxID=1469910 RepID=A0A6A6ZG29_9PLEO|nr:hypothetical protein CC86DRAFT_148859 [Ophiobolus disseminans]
MSVQSSKTILQTTSVAHVQHKHNSAKMNTEPIAIVGSGCRFPGEASSPSKLWELLRQPHDVSSKIDRRFAAKSFYHKDGHHHGASNVLDAYLLEEDPHLFDAQLFNIQGGEAASMDPQQRVLIEVVYEALELAGLNQLSGTNTGVYVGVMCNDFSQITYSDLDNIPKYAATGTAASILSNRLSYFFNWKGPSMTIDTACSSSLIAVHQAVQLLRSGQSRVAVAAGSNLIFSPTNFIAESNLNMLSPTGRSRMWDNDADGYARGEGVGCVILKRLSDAIADGDNIECVIRETGTNQDGRTPGITMPSSESQAELIRETYSRAGLNPLLETDRCQYFEAHGTGTKAGDPQEASAIYQAFVSDKGATDDQHLYVGSIKTVIGHTEGTAGIAGLLKASLSIQNGTIPPNMLFNELNPAIEPYYGFLQIPTTAKAWPKLPPGVPRRASVNSFGFGGANAHAIIESYTPAATATERATTDNPLPIAFSANSEKALVSQLRTWLQFLEQQPPSAINVRDLAWTLSRRTPLNQRACFAASTVEALVEALRTAVEVKDDEVGVRTSAKKSKIFGVFTGQGAQWPAMGRGLVQCSPVAEATLKHLDTSLQSLPEEDRPSWSLSEELFKTGKESRVLEAEFSQPLCTAVQIILTDMLSAVGVTFEAVVGHSSGEIGAAYTCGYLSAWDAIRIAYLRGRVSHLAHANGAMLAVGTSLEDATELCSLPIFRGRLTVAASNSASSVTLSGDLKAVERAKVVLDDESKFTRMLKVDKAYHSHHMEPCSEPYMEAMSRAGIHVLEPKDGPRCRWFSSVLGGTEATPSIVDLSGSYWRDNLVQPVLFHQALEAALASTSAAASLGLVVEVGPHPALKGPASSVIEESCGSGVPYTGVLSRGSNDVEALSAGIGAVWCNILSAPTALSLSNFASLFSGSDATPALLKSVPTYTWDHSRAYFTESRATKRLLSRPSGHHELLGVRLDGGPNDFRWRNFIKPQEMPWLRGHQIQGQMVFPGAGFASIAIEASKAVVDDEQVAVVEILDLQVRRAMSLNDDAVGVEILITLSNVVRDEQHGTITYDFECAICPDADSAPFAASTARIRLEMRDSSDSSPSSLVQRFPLGLDMNPLDVDHFYNSLASSGYNYSDMFRSIQSIERTTDKSSGIIHVEVPNDYDVSDITLHPAPLDVAFQAVFGALGYPGDGRLWTTLVPTTISRIKIDPRACKLNSGLRSDISFDAFLSASASKGISGDVDMFNATGQALVQIEGLSLSPLSALTPQDDKQMVSKMVWGPEKPDATRDVTEWQLGSANLTEDGANFVQRACFFYMKGLNEAITHEERAACEWHPRKYLTWVAYTVDEVAAGKHPIIQQEWLNDTWETIEPMVEAFKQEQGDLSLTISTIGESLIPWARGELDLLELYRETNMLEHIHKNLVGFSEFNEYLGKLVDQLAHRFQQMDILELGASTGSTTEVVMRHIEDRFRSYTYTDISSDLFPKAEIDFKKYADKFVYSTLDIEKDPAEQQYLAHNYDLIVVSNVLHGTKSLESTLKNIRKLLKPGGYLVFLETTDMDPVHPTFVSGTLADWWVGEDDEPRQHPLITRDSWADLLQKTGFSGIDTQTPGSGHFMAPQGVMLSQAVDVQMELIRQPLNSDGIIKPALNDILIIGGRSMAVFTLVEDILELLQPLAKTISRVERFDELEESHFTDKQMILSVAELEEHIFDPFTPAKWKSMQIMTEKARSIVWVTHGGLSGTQPYGHMMAGVARCLYSEKPAMTFQIVDFDAQDVSDIQPATIAEAVLRMQISNAWTSLPEPYTPTWTLEREVRVGLDGTMSIPRYLPNDELDARYNASRRVIRSDRVPGDDVTIVEHRGVYELERVVQSEWASKDQSSPQDIQVDRSSLMALTVESVGALFLVTGNLVGSSKPVIALSASNSSKISPPASWRIEFDTHLSGVDPSLLVTEAIHACWIEKILSMTPNNTVMLVHEPPTTRFASALRNAAADRHLTVHFTTSQRDDSDYTFIHPSRHDRALSRLLPRNLATFVVMSGDVDMEGIASRMERQLPSQCNVINLSMLMAKEAYVRPSTSPDTVIPGILDRVSRYLQDSSAASPGGLFDEVPIAQVAGNHIPLHQKGRVAVLNWTTSEIVPLRLYPAEDIVQFRPDKTYLLIGLAGQLGISLCDWMAQRGARHIVVTSRNPKVNKAWLDSIQADGVHLEVLPCDVTDRRSVLKMYQTICKTMPPVAGVCNGAMIMNDGIIPHMTYERFNQTLRPKVDGTRFLNEVFDKPTLDFFIVFSSLAYVTGNIGQTPYATANAFMVSMVEGRRARGLAGSILNMAGIAGIGYISRTNAGILERLAKLGFSNMSEWDFLQFFAEAVLAGKPGSRSTAYDISSSLHPYDAEQETDPPAWLPIPTFSYYKRTKRQSLDEEDAQETSVRARLRKQTTKEGIASVIQAGLSATLYKLLNIRPEDANIRADTRLVDLGIDSLVAVDMRSWFSKELDLDMPVLKLLGGATVEEMVQDTTERLSPDFTPKLKAEDEEVLVQEETSPEVQSESTSDSGTPSSASDTKSVSSPSSVSEDGSLEDEKSIVDATDLGTNQDLVFESKQSMGYPALQFWFLLQQQKLRSAFHCTFRIAFRGRMDVNRMAQAVKQLGERHDSMRTAFFDDPSNGYEPTQAALAPSASPLRLETRKVSSLQEAVEFTDDLHQRYVYKLDRGEVVRIALLSENDQTHYLVIGTHHIAIDGYSFFLFLRELVELYAGRPVEPVLMPWNDIIKEQKLAVDNGSMASEVAFWKKQLVGPNGVPEPLPMLPCAKVQSRVPVSTFRLEQVPMVTLKPALVRAIRERCRKLKVTRFHFFMTVLRLMLMELAGVNELCIGMVDAGRTDVRSTKLVGLMVNVLPLRFQKKASQSFAQICREVRDQAYMAQAHSRLPFKAMLEQLGVPLSNNAAPIFQAMLSYLPQKFEYGAFEGTETDEVKSHLNYSLTDMNVDINDISESEIKFRFSAQTDLYSRDAVQTLMNTYVKLTEKFANSESIEGMLELYDAGQVKDAVTMSLGDLEPDNFRQTASHIIQEIGSKAPDAIALKDGSGTTLTYSQMAQRVSQIELALVHSGEKLERVACYQQPTADWICSLLAVWKAGATYISLDSRLPESRISTLLELSKPSAILCCPETLEVTRAVAKDCRVLDVKNLPQVTDSQVDATTNAKLDCPALVIFTSGSTGTPKCVEICHSSLANVITGSLARHCREGESLVALQQSAVSFDLCFGQVLMGLCSGGSVVVASRDQRSDPQEICKIIRDESVSFIIATPSELAYWFRYGKAELNEVTSLRYAFAGGEALPSTLKTSFRQLNKDVKLVNVYGPAEASVWCTTAEIDYSTEEHVDVAIPVGRPVANCGVFVVDKNLKPVPSGVSGEIAVTGAGVANGYFGQEKLTKAAFLPDLLTPAGYFSQAVTKKQMYRTGDGGRFGADGQLYYEGRIQGDSQIKLNGIRIEIREVESAILRASHGVLGNAVVSARRNPDFLVGHVEFEPGYYGPQEQKQFLESLVSRLPLPKYMCPALLVPLDRIPVNAHGKTDRLAAQALPLPSLSRHNEGESEATKTESTLLEIWKEVLPIDLTLAIAIRPETDFFSLGGGSYLLVRVQRLIRDRFHVSIPVRELFGTSTLREMSSSVDAATAISAIDWQIETALDGISRDATDLELAAPVKTAGMTVVLTGATGYLGRNILKTLLENPAVSTIHCVAVRDETRVHHFEVNTTAQIVVHTASQRSRRPDPQRRKPILLGLIPDAPWCQRQLDQNPDPNGIPPPRPIALYLKRRPRPQARLRRRKRRISRARYQPQLPAHGRLQRLHRVQVGIRSLPRARRPRPRHPRQHPPRHGRREQHARPRGRTPSRRVPQHGRATQSCAAFARLARVVRCPAHFIIVHVAYGQFSAKAAAASGW